MDTATADEIRLTITRFMAGRLPSAQAKAMTDETPLLTGALDSLGVLELMMFLDQTYGIALEDVDFDAENLETVGRLVRFVERKRAA